MAIVKPFRGLRPRPDLVAKVASPPYDVLDSDEARRMVKDNPLSFLRVVKPEVDLDPSVDLYSDEVYRQGAANLRSLMENGAMIQDSQPLFYFYRQVMEDHSQTGLVSCVSALDYENDVIKKHEHTREAKEKDRVRHIEAQNAQSGPVFLTYRDLDAVSDIQERVCSGESLYDFTAEDGVRHTFWKVPAEDQAAGIIQAFAALPTLYVADGHHRSAAGTIVARKRRQSNPNHTGEEEYNFFLAVLFPKSHMKILPYNRVVTDLAGLSEESFMTRVGQTFEIIAGADPSPQAPRRYSMYISGSWFGLHPREGTYDPSDPVGSLDASILQSNLLSPVLGIDDPRKSERIDFVGGIRGTAELQRLVDSGEYSVAFSMYPTTVDQLISVAESGKVMPPKSTWFEPKLRSGIVVHVL
jgi:uncharacterized protein (DUF1015 family)